jgi:prolyl-tRNA synthetase
VPAPALTPPGEDFPRWYQDVVAKAELADNGPVRGTMVIRPYGYAIWERIQAALDERIKALGAENAYFPLFIPESYFAREAEHVEGFSPELAVVTHAGGEELAEPIIVRPTSETVIGEFMAKWIQSHRDLPLKLNQWCNVVRWEMRTRLFLRTTEFLWQEGHTAHASAAEASAFARRVHLEVYNDAFESAMALSSELGVKSPGERFAGAVNSMGVETMMGDGKALQMATSHELGQNFSRAFGISYQGEDGQSALCFTTSWGTSTRVVGGLIMGHGDERGLVIPPTIAPIQAVVLPVNSDAGVMAACGDLASALVAPGVRVRSDDGRGSFGRRVTDWEIKGVPVRVEVGPRDLANGVVTVVRRDTGEKDACEVARVASRVTALLTEIQSSMLEASRAALRRRTVDVESVAAALEAAQDGFARIEWDRLRDGGEAVLAQQAVTVRCLQRADRSMPDSADERELVAVVGRSY